MAERAGLVADIAAAWRDFRGSLDRQLAVRPPEARLLAYVYVACVIGFAAGLPAAWRQAQTLDVDNALVAVVAGRLLAALFFAPLLFYALAAIGHLVSRLFGGKGSYYEARLALFWALLVASPLVILNGFVTAISGGLPVITTTIGALSGSFFLWIWALYIARTECFRYPAMVFLFALIIIVSILATLLRI